MIIATGLPGCASLSYYSQAVSGHLDLMGRRQSIEKVIEHPDTSPELRERLQTVLEMRRFASDELQLPDNRSYTHYADLERDAAVWLLTAAPELSLQPQTWCYLVVGCLSYRGYFERQRADAAAARLSAEGMDTRVSPGLAYSTLGFMADPVLNTMLAYGDDDLAGILFHELAHQVLYLKGDSQFSESFASAVEQVGRQRWMASRGRNQDAAAAARRQQRNREFNALMLGARGRLDKLFKQSIHDSAKRTVKQDIYTELAQQYQQFRIRWDGFTGFDHWFEDGPNNADLALLATYELSVPAFLSLLEENDGDLGSFYVAARKLSRQPDDERRQRLRELAAKRPANDTTAVTGGH